LTANKSDVKPVDAREAQLDGLTEKIGGHLSATIDLLCPGVRFVLIFMEERPDYQHQCTVSNLESPSRIVSVLENATEDMKKRVT